MKEERNFATDFHTNIIGTSGIRGNCLSDFFVIFSATKRAPVWYEPTDVKKACKIFKSHPGWQKVLHFVSPNVKELFTMAEYFSIKNSDHIPLDGERELVTEVAEKLGEYIPVVLTTMGPEGVLIVREGSQDDVFYPKNSINSLSLIKSGSRQSRIYPPLLKVNENSNDKKYSVSGCGDCLAAGIITGILRGSTEESCVTLGLKAAQLSLESLETVPKTLENLRQDKLPKKSKGDSQKISMASVI